MSTTAIDQRVEREHLTFALTMQRALAPDPTVPACWSPFSVASALGLVATGARGTTRDELTTLLVGSPSGDLAGQAAMLAGATRFEAVRRGEPPVFGVSNTLWARPDIAIREAFAEELLSWPNGAMRDAPFTTDPEAARAMINRDVADTTHGLIPDLIPSDAVGPGTVAALVNALYLKVAWQHRFPENATEPRPFHAPGGDVDVPTMRLTRQLGYAAAGGWRAVTLPALGGVDMSVLLPDGEPVDLAPETLRTLLDEQRTQRVDLFLPRFKVRASASLRDVLEGLGVRTMFTQAADLTGITDAPLLVDKVLHEAVLTVDENGLEGAAATAVAMRLAMVTPMGEPVVVRVDRPFLVLVRHRATGAGYFLARVVRP